MTRTLPGFQRGPRSGLTAPQVRGDTGTRRLQDKVSVPPSPTSQPRAQRFPSSPRELCPPRTPRPHRLCGPALSLGVAMSGPTAGPQLRPRAQVHRCVLLSPTRPAPTERQRGGGHSPTPTTGAALVGRLTRSLLSWGAMSTRAPAPHSTRHRLFPPGRSAVWGLAPTGGAGGRGGGVPSRPGRPPSIRAEPRVRGLRFPPSVAAWGRWRSQVDGPLRFELLRRPLTGPKLELAPVNVGEEAVGFHGEHAVALGDD